MLAIHPDKPGRNNAAFKRIVTHTSNLLCAKTDGWIYSQMKQKQLNKPLFQPFGFWQPRAKWRIEIHLKVPDICF